MMRRLPALRLLAFLGVCGLSGCALLPSPASTGARPAHLDAASFAVNGRISINHDGERHSAGLHWTHRGQSDEILLLTPLGQTAARIFRDAHTATLDNGDRHYQAGNVEALMEDVLDWHLPLNGLHQWVLGLPDSGSHAEITRDDKGRISELQQDGWDVHYLRYDDNLPARLRLSREHLTLLLLIDQWQWNPN